MLISIDSYGERWHLPFAEKLMKDDDTYEKNLHPN
jgi:hypothetical protein